MSYLLRFFICCAVALACLSGMAEAEKAPVFRPGDVPGAYRFDTGVVRGVLRDGNISLGLYPIEHVATGRPLAGMMGLLNYYRIFTPGHRYGESMRAVPAETEQIAPDTVRVHWTADAERPFTLTALYRWSAPDTLDVVTEVEARTDLPDFEVFLASYASAHFPVSSVYVRQDDGRKAFMTAEPEGGVWQMFPRDDAAVRMIQDGRWTIEPSPVDWAIRPRFAAPLLYRRDLESKLALILMTRPEDCFAVSTPDRGEGHYSMYLSLFGQTLASGESARAYSRLIFADLDEPDIVARYETFVQTFPKAP